jgi:hypothetical protein
MMSTRCPGSALPASVSACSAVTAEIGTTAAWAKVRFAGLPGVKQLALARWSFIAGIVLLAAAIGVTWVDSAASADPLVSVHVGDHVYSGTPVESASGEIVLDTAGPGGEQTVLRIRDVTDVEIMESCD